MNNHKRHLFSRRTIIGPAVVIAIWVLSSPGHARFGGGFAGGGFRGPVGGGFRGGSSGFHYGGDGFAGGNPEHTSWSSESHPQSGSRPYGSSYPSYHPNEQSASSYKQFNQEHPNSNMGYKNYNQASANYNQYKSEHPSDTSTTSNTYNSKSYNYNSTNPNSSNQSYHPYGTTTAESAYSTNQAARYNEMNSMNQTRYNEAESMQHESYQNQSALSQQHYNQASDLQSNSNYANWARLEVACVTPALEKGESESFDELNERVRAFPAAVIDLGAVRLDPRTLPLVRPHDPVLLVVRSGYTERSDLLATINLFSSVGRSVRGVILNATESAKPRWIKRLLGKNWEG